MNDRGARTCASRVKFAEKERINLCPLSVARKRAEWQPRRRIDLSWPHCQAGSRPWFHVISLPWRTVRKHRPNRLCKNPLRCGDRCATRCATWHTVATFVPNRFAASPRTFSLRLLPDPTFLPGKAPSGPHFFVVVSTCPLPRACTKNASYFSISSTQGTWSPLAASTFSTNGPLRAAHRAS